MVLKMMVRFFVYLLLFVSFSFHLVVSQPSISVKEYEQRRQAVLSKMDSGSVAVFRSSDVRNRNSDCDYRYRQNSTFLYLTGCTESNSTLVLIADGYRIDSSTNVKEILFVRQRSKGWTGENLGIEGAKERLGFGAEGLPGIALVTGKVKEIVPEILKSKKILYFTSSSDYISDPISEIRFITTKEAKKSLEEKYPNLILKSSGPLVSELRTIKSSGELQLMQKAIDATVEAQIEAANMCQPNMFEYQLQAKIEYCFAVNGCEYYGFPSIVGSGPNSLSFHYEANRRQMLSGELVVIDIGGEFEGYSADVTRTYPVNGKYSPEQKAIYEIVLAAQDSAIQKVKPGEMMNTPGKKAMDVIGEGLVKLGILKDKADARTYCPHGVSHFLGLDVHDVGDMGKLAPGMVITMEPGIYIPDSSDCDKRYWGIGIRIEDDVEVTSQGYRVLSSAAPKTTIEIEKLMSKPVPPTAKGRKKIL
jgi:Xaa-Pro aminopeptidase